MNLTTGREEIAHEGDLHTDSFYKHTILFKQTPDGWFWKYKG